MKNPFEVSVDEQIRGFSRERQEMLRETAPPWPEGSSLYRSLEIRIGYGEEGVKETLLFHLKQIENVFGRSHILSPSYFKEFRLVGGDHQHEPSTRWVIIDEGSNGRPLADQGLAFCWLFPGRFMSGTNCVLSGYEVNTDKEEKELLFKNKFPASLIRAAGGEVDGGDWDLVSLPTHLFQP